MAEEKKPEPEVKPKEPMVEMTRELRDNLVRYLGKTFIYEPIHGVINALNSLEEPKP